MDALEHGLRYAESPEDLLDLGAELVGEFCAGLFSTGSLRLCNKSLIPIVVYSLSVGGGGVRGEVAGFSPTVVGAGECCEFKVSLLAEAPGDVPVKVYLRAELPGGVTVEHSISTSAKVVSGGSGASVFLQQSRRGRGSAGLGASSSVVSVFERPVPALLFVGRVLRLGFRVPGVQPLPRPFRLGGLEVRGLVGLGGFAATLLGVDEVGRSFVVKVPREVYEALVYGVTYSPSERGLAVFSREFEVLRGLDHTHLIKVVGGGVSEAGVPYIVMEFCGNGSLRGVLESSGRLGFEEVLLIGVQVADALNYLHSQGIAHRDLKPENILFTGEGLLKVADFNIAKVMRTVSPTTSRRPAYTPGYAAPEQFMAGLGRSGPWSDVWALGVILYEALAGEPPFSPWDYEDAVREGEPDLSKVPSEIGDLIKRMLSINPKQRPTAKEAEEEPANTLARTLRK